MFQNVPVKHTIDYHGQKLSLETGILAQQATATVLATIGETTVLAAVVVGKETKADYFPLQVIYEEKLYATGKIKGSRFIKREGRPSEKAVLTGRMIDRSLRSLFDPDIRNDIQVIITVLSVDEVNPPDTLAVLAASSALEMCGIERFQGPISSVRIGLINDPRPTLANHTIALIPQADNYSEVKELLTDLCGILDIANLEQKELFGKVFYALKDKDKEWAINFKSLYQNTPKLTEKEIEDKYLKTARQQVNPSYEEQKKSDLDLVISGDGYNIMMLEAGANIVDESIINEALETASKELKVLTDFQKAFVELAQKEGLTKTSTLKVIGDDPSALEYWNSFYNEFEETYYRQDLDKTTKNEHIQNLKDETYGVLDKVLEYQKKENFTGLDNLKQHTLKTFEEFKKELEDYDTKVRVVNELFKQIDSFSELEGFAVELANAFPNVVKKIVKRNILENERRLDGRSLTETRKITCQTEVLPRVHGSSLFERGETQVLNVLTLGTKSDAQILDDMEDFEETTKRYIHHYNFPSYSVGETGRYFGPGRREIGHGALAEKAILPVLPSEEEFPYTMRLVSECMGSNGSTSMASTCSSCLSLMQGGVPIKDLVAGVAMGLVLDSKTGNFKVITDIQGSEDHYGDMDFKVTGTATGITAIQLDNKAAGLTVDILKQALVQSKAARMHILGIMKESISEPAKDISKYAPRALKIQIPMDKVGDVIGPSGKIIKGIIAKTDTAIDIEDETGLTYIYGKDAEKAQEAYDIIKGIIKVYEAGETVEGKVFRIEKYGAFVKIDGTEKEGLIHISNIANRRLEKVEDALSMGQVVTAKITEVNEKGQIGLSMKKSLSEMSDQREPIAKPKPTPKKEKSE